MDSELFKGYLIVLDKVHDVLFLDQKKTTLIEIGKKPGNDFLMPLRLAKILRREKIDIVHTHAWGTLVEGVLGARLAGCPLAIHGEHGTFHKDLKRRFVQYLFFNKANYLLSVSEVLARNLRKTIGFKKSIKVILNGVDTDRFFPDKSKKEFYRQKYNIPNNKIVIGTVGRTVRVKNHRLMIEAARELRKHRDDFVMTIIGDAFNYSTRSADEALVREYRLEDCVYFRGMQNDIPGYLNSFDVFVLPSLSEGCSNVIQEAMATALPVIASDVGGNPELVIPSETGFLFSSNNIFAFADAINLLLDNKKLRKNLGENGLNYTLQKFSLNIMIKEYQNFYKQSLDNHTK